MAARCQRHMQVVHIDRSLQTVCVVVGLLKSEMKRHDQVQVESEFKVQGLELRAPEIFPSTMKQGEVQEGATAVARHAACVAQDPATHPRAEVHAKSLMKALSAASLTQSELLLLSTGDANRAIVHVLCAFMSDGEVLADYAFNIWLPGRDPEEL